ncbi:mitogen-activated protein kinase kinase kinase 11-like [Marmota monax]|uniref:mitogen-activated protein kinase kinase kinase 11-like n=1 Tax=Marmota monax TaxID=9995 RepID=UPI001EB06DE7|nr:mitogen-activated protein kinase kinase kinase 11-like [Marmota monax]
MFPCHPPSRRRWARPPAPACLRNSRKRAISSQTGGDSGPAGPPHTPPAARARAPRPPDDLLRPEAGSQGGGPSTLERRPGSSAGLLALGLIAQRGWEMGVAEDPAAPGPELRSPIFFSAIFAHNIFEKEHFGEIRSDRSKSLRGG